MTVDTSSVTTIAHRRRRLAVPAALTLLGALGACAPYSSRRAQLEYRAGPLAPEPPAAAAVAETPVQHGMESADAAPDDRR